MHRRFECRAGCLVLAFLQAGGFRRREAQMHPRHRSGQVQIMRYARQMQYPVNSGLPDLRTGFVFCRLRYDRVRRQRKSGWWDDYPASDYNFMERFEELTTVTISHWLNGDPGFAQVTLQDPDLY